MRMHLAALFLFALAGCASTGAVAQNRACICTDSTWRTSWTTPDGAGPGGYAPLTIHVVTPSGEFEGTWGDPVAGEVWGNIVGPDNSTIVGQWGTRRETGADGAFLLQISPPLPDHPESCSFEGVYTGSAGQSPLSWIGDRVE